VFTSRRRRRIRDRERQLAVLAEVGSITDSAETVEAGFQQLLGLVVPALADIAFVKIEGVVVAAVPEAPPADAASTFEVPLRARGQHLGELGLSTLAGTPPLDSGDEEFARLLAGRAALALDNVRLRAVAEATQRRLDGILGALAEAVTVQGPDGRLVYVNKAAVELLGFSTAEEVLACEPGEIIDRFEVFDEQGGKVSLADLPGVRLLAGEDPEPLLVRNVVPETGERRWLLTKATGFLDERVGETLAVNVIENVTSTKEAEQRQRFLAEAGELLAASLSWEETLANVARLAVPTIADWCSIQVVGRDGVLRQVAVAHPDPDKERLAWELNERYPTRPDDPAGAPNVIRTGEAEVVNDITDEMLVEASPDEELLEILRDLRLRASIIAPLTVRGETIGALTLIGAETKSRFSDADIALAMELARRSAVAVSNARLYTELSEIAETLQEGLSPARLPEVPGWSLAAIYRAAGEGSQVGGDFYDLIPLHDGGWMALIGDVTGKGVQAAALTALVRYTARTAGRFEREPARILALVNAALRNEPAFSVCTAACMRFPSADGREPAVIANAGHPPPLRVRGGRVEPVGENGTLLGAFNEGRWPQAVVELAAGDTILLYTDGVTEARGPRQRFGEHRLVEAVEGSAATPAELVRAVDGAVSQFRAGPLDDDTALFALQYMGTEVADAVGERAVA
jgi:serine phosphatase RsbU (regulator of sigma subunit)